jgi:hypothetical protein
MPEETVSQPVSPLRGSAQLPTRTRRSRAGLTSIPQLRGWFDRYSSCFFHRKILLSVVTQSLKGVSFEEAEP